MSNRILSIPTTICITRRIVIISFHYHLFYEPSQDKLKIRFLEYLFGSKSAVMTLILLTFRSHFLVLLYISIVSPRAGSSTLGTVQFISPQQTDINSRGIVLFQPDRQIWGACSRVGLYLLDYDLINWNFLSCATWNEGVVVVASLSMCKSTI